MTLRELFRAILHFEPADSTPFLQLEDVTAQAERRWVRDEGAPVDRPCTDAIGFDGPLITLPFGDQAPIPSFRPCTLRSDGRYTFTRDRFGFTVQTETGSALTPINYIYVDAPLRTLSDWDALKARFDPLDPRRLPDWWGEGAIRELNDSPDPVVVNMVWGPARGIKNCYMFGFERFMELLADEPGTIDAVFAFWADYMIAFFERFIDALEIDAFIFSEDGMGFKNSSMVSPATFGAVYAPHMSKVTRFLRSRGVDVIGYYSSGNLMPLIPSFLRAGINLLAPVEAAAGMDAVALRKEYGRDLLMVGNIAREAVMSGPDAIRREVERKLPFLMASGGYIPGFDDMIMPDMRFEDVKRFVEMVKGVTPGKPRSFPTTGGVM